MTGDGGNDPGGFDPLRIIDRAVRNEARQAFGEFLTTYRHVEFGEHRPLCAEEVSLVLRALDDFLGTSPFPALGVLNAGLLHQRLANCAKAQVLDPLAARNACFDALAYIRRLETVVERVTIRMDTRTGSAVHASNDA